MRNVRMRRKNLLLTILALSLTLTPAMFAQQRRAVSTASASTQEDRQVGPGVPWCKDVVQSVGGNPTDNFASPYELTAKSPGLQGFFSSNQLTPRNYDEPGSNKAFGCSFFLKCCKVCRAELEIRIRKEASGSSAGDNDAITIGQAPFPAGMRAADGFLWKSPFVPGASATDPTPIKTITIPLSAAKLNSYILNSDGCNVPLDIYVQDDTAVDYVKLRIWY